MKDWELADSQPTRVNIKLDNVGSDFQRADLMDFALSTGFAGVSFRLGRLWLLWDTQ